MTAPGRPRPSPQDEKDQLTEYRGHLSGLAKRAKAVVQLKPRNPAHPARGRVPLLAVCDYKQVEVRLGLAGRRGGCVRGARRGGRGVAALTAPLPQVTVHKGDQCQLVGPMQPNHWKVVSSSGSEAAVPSVCFLVPPPNPEAQEAVARWVAWGLAAGAVAGVGGCLAPLTEP